MGLNKNFKKCFKNNFFKFLYGECALIHKEVLCKLSKEIIFKLPVI